MNFPFYIAKRYLFSKSAQNAINIINIVTSVVVVIGALALFIVLSGFAGLKTFSLSFSNEFDPDLKIEAAVGKNFIVSKQQLDSLRHFNDIVSYTKVVEERVLLNYKNTQHIANLKGVDAHYNKVNAIDSILFVGKWLDDSISDEVVLGLGIANYLNVVPYDFSNLLEIIVPKPGTKSITSVSTQSPYDNVNVLTKGIYRINEELDNKYVFSTLALAQELLRFEANQVTHIEIKLRPETNEEEVRAKLLQLFDNNVIIKNRIQLNDALYRMLNTENLAIYLIFTLVLIIALFNVVGSIVMMVLDKRKNMKTLFNLGATVKEIRQIFFLQGVLVSIIGGLLGILLGVIIVWLQLQYKLVMITQTLAYPVELKFINVVIVFLTIAVLGILASTLASRRINHTLIKSA